MGGVSTVTSPSIDTGLSYTGKVTATPAADQFTIPSLAGMGAGKFDGPLNPYMAFVQRNVAGTGLAPQGQINLITAYDTNTGNFTAPGFAPPVAIGDDMMIVVGFTASGATPQQIYDGVILNAVVGTPGTGGNKGTWGDPVDNLTDAMAIAVANRKDKIYIYNDYVGSGGLLIPAGPFPDYPIELIGIGPNSGVNLNGCIGWILYRNLIISGLGSVGTGGTFINCQMDNPSIDASEVIDCRPFFDPNTGIVVSPSTFKVLGIHLTHVVNFQGDMVIDYDGVAGFVDVFEATGTVKIINMSGGGGPIIYGAGCRVLGDPTDISGDLELFGDCLFQPNGAFWATTIINTEQVESAWAEIDGVYYDPVAGESIVLAPDGITYSARIGLPDTPAVSLSDAQIILAARNLKKLYLSGARVFTGTQTGAVNPTVMTDADADPFRPFCFAGGAWTIRNITDGSSGVITTNDAHTITVAALAGGASNQWNPGDAYDVVDASGNQPYRITFDTPVNSQGLQLVGSLGYDVDFKVIGLLEGDLICQNLINEGSGLVIIKGNCRVGANVLNSGGGDLVIIGKLDINGDSPTDPLLNGVLSNIGGNQIKVDGDVFVAGSILNPGNTSILIIGNLKQAFGNIINQGLMIIDGNVSGNNFSTDTAPSIVDVNGDLVLWGQLSVGLGHFKITGDCRAQQISMTGAGGALDIYGNCFAGGVAGTLGGQCTIWGNCYISGQIAATCLMLQGACLLEVIGELVCGKEVGLVDAGRLNAGKLTVKGNLNHASSDTINILGDTQIDGNLVVSAAGQFNTTGKMEIGIRLDATGSGNISIGGECVVGQDIVLTTGGIIITGDCRAQFVNNRSGVVFEVLGSLVLAGNTIAAGHILNDSGGKVIVHGDTSISGEPTSPGGYIQTSGVSEVKIYGNLFMTGNIVNPDVGCIITVIGKAYIAGLINNGGTLNIGPLECIGDISNTIGPLVVNGDCHMNGLLTNTTGSITISGDCLEPASVSNTEGNITINGNLLTTDGGITNTLGSVLVRGDANLGGNLVQSDTGSITIVGKTIVAQVVPSAGSIFTTGDCKTQQIAATGGSLDVYGNLFVEFVLANTKCVITVYGDVFPGDINQSDTGALKIYGQLIVNTGHIINSGGGTITVLGNLEIYGDPTTPDGYLDNTGGGNIAITGDAYIAGTLTNPAAVITISGKATVGGNIINAGTLTIIGIGHFYGTITNTGTLTYHNVEEVQAGAKTIDLNQVAGNYDLFTGTLIPVILESLVITMPNLVAGGALTSISIQTDDATPQVIIATTPVASLTAENQLFMAAGRIRIGVGKKIQLTINGGATGVAYVCDVDAQYKGVTAGGYLA